MMRHRCLEHDKIFFVRHHCVAAWLEWARLNDVRHPRTYLLPVSWQRVSADSTVRAPASVRGAMADSFAVVCT